MRSFAIICLGYHVQPFPPAPAPAAAAAANANLAGWMVNANPSPTIQSSLVAASSLAVPPNQGELVVIWLYVLLVT